MPTTTISLSAFQTACAEVADAVSGESWATAYKWYARAEAIHSALAAQVQDQGTFLRRRETLKGLKEALDAARMATAAEGSTSRFITTQTRHSR